MFYDLFMLAILKLFPRPLPDVAVAGVAAATATASGWSRLAVISQGSFFQRQFDSFRHYHLRRPGVINLLPATVSRLQCNQTYL
jgi:hypothetical protein